MRDIDRNLSQIHIRIIDDYTGKNNVSDVSRFKNNTQNVSAHSSSILKFSRQNSFNPLAD